MGDTGFDSPSNSAEKAGAAHQGGARDDASLNLADDNAGLATIMAAWPMLSADARRAVLGFVDRELGVAARALVEANDAVR